MSLSRKVWEGKSCAMMSEPEYLPICFSAFREKAMTSQCMEDMVYDGKFFVAVFGG